jgi:putative addiction module component (TIGR02574 family)
MTTAIKDLADEVLQLSPEDRAFLAERLLDSLDEVEIDDAWGKEAKRRRDEVRRGKVKPIPAEKVYQRIERLLKK